MIAPLPCLHREYIELCLKSLTETTIVHSLNRNQWVAVVPFVIFFPVITKSGTQVIPAPEVRISRYQDMFNFPQVIIIFYAKITEMYLPLAWIFRFDRCLMWRPQPSYYRLITTVAGYARLSRCTISKQRMTWGGGYSYNNQDLLVCAACSNESPFHKKSLTWHGSHFLQKYLYKQVSIFPKSWKMGL